MKIQRTFDHDVDSVCIKKSVLRTLSQSETERENDTNRYPPYPETVAYRRR